MLIRHVMVLDCRPKTGAEAYRIALTSDDKQGCIISKLTEQERIEDKINLKAERLFTCSKAQISVAMDQFDRLAWNLNQTSCIVAEIAVKAGKDKS